MTHPSIEMRERHTISNHRTPVLRFVQSASNPDRRRTSFSNITVSSSKLEKEIRFNMKNMSRMSIHGLQAVLALFVLMSISTSTALQLGFRRSTISRSTTSKSTLSMVSTSQPVDDFRSVLADVVDVIITTGPRQGFARSFQIATAVSKLTRKFVSDQKSFQDDSGSLSLPKTLKRLFEELGATYIKLGQFIASSPTLFPAELVLEFQSCLDNGPTVSYNLIREIIQEDLKKPISSVYSFVDPTPLASASVAQVHRARLKDGTEVVIKVRKPGVDSNLQVDLGFLYVSSRIVEFLNPTLGRVSFSAIVGDLRTSMLDELDFTREAKNLVIFRDFLEKNGIKGAYAPKPYAEFSGKQVLTMEYLKGVPLVNIDGVKKYSADTADTLFTAISTWGKSVAELDMFHADLHGGNLLVLEDGRIAFLDFGIVGRITKPTLAAVGALLLATVNSDYDGVAAALVRIGASKADIDQGKLGRELREVIEKITALKPEPSAAGGSVSTRMSIDDRESTKLVLEVVAIAENNSLRLPREFGLLLKQALYFDRYQKLLAPGSDPLRDPKFRDYLNMEMGGAPIGTGPNSSADSTPKAATHSASGSSSSASSGPSPDWSPNSSVASPVVGSSTSTGGVDSDWVIDTEILQ